VHIRDFRRYLTLSALTLIGAGGVGLPAFAAPAYTPITPTIQRTIPTAVI